MHASLRALALAWLMLALVILAPLPGTRAEAQSPGAPPPSPASPEAPAASPSAAPGVSPDKVRTEVAQFTKFLDLLARGKVEGGQPRLVIAPRFDAAARKVGLKQDDEKHVKEVMGQLPQLEAFKLLDPDKQANVTNALDALLAPAEPTAGSNDPLVITFDATKEFEQRIAKLAVALDVMAAVLDARQTAAGITQPIAKLFQPKPGGAVPAPAGTPPVAAKPPPPLADDGPAAGGAGAGGAGLSPCADARERVTAARKATASALKPIDALISAGDRALTNRYFTLARDALEKAADRLVELEREWRDIAESLKPPAYTIADLLEPSCTDVLTTALTNAIAINDLLQRVHPKLGAVYTELGQHDRAAREIARATAINPGNPKTWAALGNAHLGADNADEAIKAFLRSVELDTYVPDVWLGLAKAYARKKENQIAIHYIRRAVSKGFVKFEKLAADPDFATLQGITEFDELVYLVPGAQPFPR